MRKRVLVFGGTRFVGRHLVEELLAEGYDVTIATRGRTPDDFGRQVKRLILDRSSAESLRQNIPDIEYDVVFDNLAYCSNEVKNLLDLIKCGRYVQISSASVYRELHEDTKEEEFDPHQKRLLYCDRGDYEYDEIKRLAECAIVQDYSHIPAVRVRFPFVIGEDDYTRRLFFYVDHTVRQKSMFVDNMDAQMAFVRSDEAGRFLAFLGDCDFTGAINGANPQTISIRQITDYVKKKTG